jgi:hypothetical protein
MSQKPTHASVTDEPCACDYLQTAADDPENPIEFDERTGEYQFRYFDQHGRCGGMLIIYHCPFCGGTAPLSKRKLLFEVVPRTEAERLAELLNPIATFDGAINKFGAPDFDSFTVSQLGEKEGEPPVTKYRREIRYHHLSEVADICISEHEDGKVRWHIQGKPL